MNRMRVLARAGTALAPRLARLAPETTSGFVQTALERAVAGVGPFPPAAEAAEAQLDEQRGDRAAAVRNVIDNHVRYAGAGGFLTNLGGMVTMTVTVPANVTGLALIQSRMVACIAHLHHYDVDDPRVRNAILVSLLGRETVDAQVRTQRIPAPPMALATAPVADRELDRQVSAEVAGELLARVAGKRAVVAASKRIPVVGGLVGAGADGWATYQIGSYAAGELRPRSRR